MRRGLLALIVTLPWLAGCGSHPIAPRVSWVDLMGPAVLAAVRAAPETIQAGGVDLRLTTFLWRDFMPMSPPDGGPLLLNLGIVTADSSAFPASLRADVAWILNGKAVWATAVTEQPRAPGDFALRVYAGGGPNWGPGLDVDVVVRLRDAGGGSWYVAARRQLIRRTD
jgi:hypothetical protein